VLPYARKKKEKKKKKTVKKWFVIDAREFSVFSLSLSLSRSRERYGQRDIVRCGGK
jgi:hypothetical protein